MASEATTQNQGDDVDKNFTSLSFQSKRDGGPDNELISLGNRFAGLDENNGLLPTTAIRRFITRAFKLATGKATNADIEYFEQLLNRAKSALMRAAS